MKTPWICKNCQAENYTEGPCHNCMQLNAVALPGSAFLRAAVRAYWRAERDAFAQFGEAFGICPATEWPGASKRANRRDSGNISSRIWSWAMKRWGREVWPSIEYRMRESPQTHEYAMKHEIRFLRGRLKFGDATDSAPFPSALVVMRPATFRLGAFSSDNESSSATRP